LTHKTTCTSEMLEKTTCRKICEKRPSTGGGTPGQATRGTCRLGRRRQVHAATAKAGTWLGLPASTLPPSPLPASTLPPSCTLYKLCTNFSKKKATCRLWLWRQGATSPEPPAKPHVGFGCGGMHLPASAQAARSTCRLARRAATRRGSFLTNFSAGGLI
jgi:hypothetical protein